MADKSVITQEKLQEYHENFVYPYLNGSSHTGFTPVGTVISYFGETAPTHFLICDGTAYNKADYPQLWTHLSSLTDTTPYVVDGDNTKFKVPDLRGEFLRGTGTNSHTDQGSGGDVGEHQDGTQIPRIWMDGNANISTKQTISFSKVSSTIGITKDDNRITGQGTWAVTPATSQGTSYSDDFSILSTTRPTNTSVLFCIAVKDIYIDYALDGFPCEITNPQDKQGLTFDATSQKWVNGAGGLHEYSTTEKVVGTWIDGRPIYEKTITGTLPNTTQSTWHEQVLMDFTGIDFYINMTGYAINKSNNLSTTLDYFWSNPSNGEVAEAFTCYSYNNSFIFRCYYGNSSWNNSDIVITIQYVKTTDLTSS